MKIKLNHKDFLTDFVDPVLAMSSPNTKVVINPYDDLIHCVVSNESDTVFLSAEHTPVEIDGDTVSWGINLMSLTRGLRCITQDDPFIDLEIKKDLGNREEAGACSFVSKQIRFNVRLLNENLIHVPRFKRDQFKNFIVTHKMFVDAERIRNIKRALEFSNDSGKFYIEQEGTDVYFLFGDKSATAKHKDDIRILVSSDVETDIPVKFYDLDILKHVLRSKSHFSINLNDRGVMFIEVETENTNLKYITTPLLK